MKKKLPQSPSDLFMEELRQLYGHLTIGTPVFERQCVTSGSQEKKAHLSEQEIVHRVCYDQTVAVHAKAIAYWCSIVYGQKDVFQKEIREIIKNPASGNDLSWKVTVDPRFAHKLSGVNVFGLKSKTRKTAERGVVFLCAAINNYTQVVKHKRDQVSSQSQQEGYEQQADRAPTTQDLQKALHKPEEKEALLTNDAVIKMFSLLSSILRYEAQIKFWCGKVYGNSDILTARVMELRKNPASGDDLSQEVAENPKAIGDLAGRNICGLKNKARIDAENSVFSLHNSIRLYANAVKRAKEQITQSDVVQRECAKSISETTQSPDRIQERGTDRVQKRDTDHVQGKFHMTSRQERLRRIGGLGAGAFTI